jgi:hypothetical protein
MDARELFLLSDAALRSVIDRLSPADLDRPVPAEWSSGHRAAASTLRDIVARHAYDEAWIPDLLAGRRVDEVGDRWSGDLLGSDPIAGILHPTSYRAFQAWQIARLVGLDFHLSPELIAGLEQLILPTVPVLRGYGAFPPEQPVPEGADAETRLLCAVGFWRE